MRGLGDNVYQRQFVRTIVAEHGGRDVYVDTPWPELYDDLPVRFVRANTALRTQAKNVARQSPDRWSAAPAGARVLAIGYGAGHLASGSILDAMRSQFRADPAPFDLPPFPRFEGETGRPLALVRPVTARREWLNTARNPDPRHVAAIAEQLLDEFEVVSVADVAGGVEWVVGDPPTAHRTFHAGELGVREMLGLVQSAAVVVGGVGWIVPACLASRTRLFCILGGQGGHNAPEKIADPKWTDLSNARFAEPDRFCRCVDMRHDCDKRNSRLLDQWSAFRRECGLLDVGG